MQNRARCLVTFALLVAAGSARAEIIGNAVVDRPSIDTAQAAIFVELQGFTQPGTISTFSFFNQDVTTVGLQITPLVFEKVASNYFIRGVGAPAVNAATGAQTFPFTLMSGSAAVGPNFFFGYKDGLDANNAQTGVIKFDFVAGAASARFFGTGHANDLVVGSNLGVGTFLGPAIGQVERVYSFQATSVPEPEGVVLVGIGALGLFAMACSRRRRLRVQCDPVHSG